MKEESLTFQIFFSSFCVYFCVYFEKGGHWKSSQKKNPATKASLTESNMKFSLTGLSRVDPPKKSREAMLVKTQEVFHLCK